MTEITHEFRPPDGFRPNYALRSEPGFMVFKILLPEAGFLRFPDFFFHHVPRWQLRALSQLVSDELLRENLVGAWHRNDTINAWDLEIHNAGTNSPGLYGDQGGPC